MFAGRDLIHSDPAVRASSVKYIKDCVTMIHELEGRNMSIVPSQVGKVVPMDTPEQEWKWAVEGLQEIYAYAQPLGIKLRSNHSIVLKPTFLIATIKRSAWPRPLAPIAGFVWMPST